MLRGWGWGWGVGGVGGGGGGVFLRCDSSEPLLRGRRCACPREMIFCRKRPASFSRVVFLFFPYRAGGGDAARTYFFGSAGGGGARGWRTGAARGERGASHGRFSSCRCSFDSELFRAMRKIPCALLAQETTPHPPAADFHSPGKIIPRFPAFPAAPEYSWKTRCCQFQRSLPLHKFYSCLF